MAGVLKPTQKEQRNEVADVKAVGGGVETAVDSDRFKVEAGTEHVKIRAVVQQTTCLQIVDDGLSGHGASEREYEFARSGGTRVWYHPGFEPNQRARHSRRVSVDVPHENPPLPAVSPDEQATSPRGRRLTWSRVGVLFAVVSTVGLWGYAFLWPQPVFGKLDDTTFPTAAEGVCAPVRSAINALPRANESANNVDRAATIDLATNQLDALLLRMETLPRGSEKANRSVGEWLDDWRIYVANRRDYAGRLKEDKTARFYVAQSDRDRRGITDAIDRFANTNKMPSCATMPDIA